MKNKTAVFCVTAAGVLWGIISIFIRKLSAAGLDPMQITLVRMAVSAPCFLGVILAAGRQHLRIRMRDLPLFAGTGIVSIVLFNICYFHTMVKAGTSVAVVLLYTSPVFIMLLSRLIFKERITLRKLAALVMTFAGCVFAAGLSGGEGLTLFTLLTGLASGLFYGLYTIFGRQALKKYNSVTVTAYTFLMGLFGSLVAGRPAALVSTVSEKPSLLLWCLGIGIICTILPYFLYTKGLSGLEPGKAAILVAVEPLVGAVFGMAAYGEDAGILKLAGIALILASIILLGTEKPDKEEA